MNLVSVVCQISHSIAALYCETHPYSCNLNFQEWGDRSMLATIALGAAQSPWGVASGAIAGHLVATTVAILGGSFLANYISEKLVGYLGGVLFLLFALATLLGVF
eukprot:TRINITY_DN574_c3_g1_i2.p2 TRINITY_DN574_c3_g1~~TRINITY_DN574_c3_g1_i2.p2  ORF type:complete len:105 (-),score=16.76 TRINITY_DN574_c3_g1_i2:723-1037(-)